MSLIRVDNFGPSAGGTTYSARGIAKAWVNFDQTVPQVDDSMNVASVTDSGAGDMTINFSSSMGAATFGATCGALTYNVAVNTITTTGSRMLSYNSAGTLTDYSFVGYSNFGDLA